MNFRTNIPNRRNLVRALAEHFNLALAYNGPPTFSYSVRSITVKRDGLVIVDTPDLAARVQSFLVDNGYLSDTPVTSTSTDDSKAEATQMPVSTDSDLSLNTQHIDRISVSIPLADCTPSQLIHILRTVYARQTLIAAMTCCDSIRMDKEVITMLSDTQPESIGKISAILISMGDAGMVTGIAVEDGKLKMDTTYNRENPTGWNNFANLLVAMADKAMNAHHVSSKRIDPEDDEMKYFCRIWLMQLGMSEAEFKDTRAALLNHLHVYAAFRSAAGVQAHREKYAQLRRKQREEAQP